MLKHSFVALALLFIAATPAVAQGGRQSQRGVVVAGPPTGADTLQYVCRGATVPVGWIVTDDIRDRDLCGGDNVATLNAYNVWVIRRLDNRPVGSLLDVCATTPTPPGWVLVDIFRSRDVCGHPENPFIVNVKRIRRAG